MSASAKPCVHGFWRTWMARVGDPVILRTAISLFIRKFTPGDVTSRRDVLFAVGVRGVYGNPTLRAMHSIHKCVVKSAPHLLALLRNELCFRKLSIYKIIIFAHFTSLARSYTRPVVSPRTLGRRTALGMFSTILAVSPLLNATSVPTG